MTHILSSANLIGGRYKIQDYVGAGGMQEVYRALDESLNRIVALKVPKNDSATKRFQRSAAMSAKVTHPNVAKTFDYLNEKGRQYLVEEFIEGEDLKSRLALHFYCLDPHLAAHLFHHLIKGLAAVHRVDVIHRDMKPSNIMVSRDPDISLVKITDFGIAKMMEAELEEAMKDADSMLGSDTIVGALPYMAPEVIKNAKDATPFADVWSAGAILYELLTGERPFGDGLAAVAKIVKVELPKKPARLTTHAQFNPLANELWTIVTKCLISDPAGRPTAQQLVEECGGLCYSRAPRCIGRIRNYGAYQGNWGFISCDGEIDDAFFHGNSFWGDTPEAGTRVSLARFSGIPSPRAYPVLPLRPEDSNAISF
jgi:serine/threonine-protein kinase